MIVVDSSVWIANLRGQVTPAVMCLHSSKAPSQILVGDIVLLEVLQGARNAEHASRIEASLRRLKSERMLDERLANAAARNYRLLRSRGITVRRTIDVVIASFCLAGRHTLLHDDRDFEPFAAHLGLRTL